MGNAPMIMMMASNIIIMFMIMLMIIIEKNVGILVVDAVSWNEDETVRIYLEREAKIKAISGEDDSEKKEALVLERFRVLLGLSKLKRTHVKPSREEWGNGSPAPAPLPSTLEAEGEGPAPAPAPIPASAAHVKPHHHRPPHPRPVLPIQRLGHHHKENSKRKTIMVAAIVSTGVAMLICACGVMWASKRMYKQQKGASKGATLCGEKSAQNLALASKVRDDPGFGLCYPTNTVTSVLELEQQACVKGTYDSLNTTVGSVNWATYETKDLGDEETKRGPRESNCSFSAEEIISVHEYSESSKYESDGQNSSNADNIVGNDNHASEDESFHSLSDSHSSSNLRLSNVSLGSFSQSNRSPNSPPTIETATFDTASSVDLPSNPPRCPLEKRNPTTSLTNIPNCPPPPPPPPPSTPFTSIAPSRPTSTAQPASKPSQSPRRVQNLSSGANHTLGDNLCSPSTTSKTTEARSNIPPPPCPPPFPNKKGTPLKGPPPPPGQPPSFTPLGKDGAPLPKLKPLHWDKVRAAPDRSMVWDKLHCNSFELDEEMIESLFGYNLQTAFKNQEGTSKSPSPSKHVLEPKRLQNITILSKALNVTAEKVCEALVQGDGLGSQQLEALVKMAPTKEEEAKLTSYKGDINELGSAEKLVKKMLIIPHAFRRIEAMLYRATFDDEVVHLRNSFSMLEEACKELRSSRLFLKLLEAVLKTGNRMNVGTIRGGARAFKLDALLKLADVKGTDGKTTLLHFVVQEIIRSEGIRMSDSIMGQIDRNSKSRTVEEKEDDYRRMGLDLVSGLSTELCNVKRTASIDLDVLATSVSNLSDGLSKLQELINKDMFKDAPNDKFVHAMKTFLNHAEKNLMELRAEEDKVLLSVRQITEYYHGDVSKDEANPLRIFVIVRDFMGMLDQVCRELKTLKTPRTPNPLAPFK